MSNVGSPERASLYVILYFLRSRRGCATIVRMARENGCPFHRSAENHAAFARRFLCVAASQRAQATRAGRPGCRGLPLLGGGLLQDGGLFLAKLELRLREDVELEREAPVLVLEGDPPAVLVALAALAGVDDVDGVLLGAHGVLLCWCAVDGSSLTEAGELSPRPTAGALTPKQPKRPQPL